MGKKDRSFNPVEAHRKLQRKKELKKNKDSKKKVKTNLETRKEAVKVVEELVRLRKHESEKDGQMDKAMRQKKQALLSKLEEINVSRRSMGLPDITESSVSIKTSQAATADGQSQEGEEDEEDEIDDDDDEDDEENEMEGKIMPLDELDGSKSEGGQARKKDRIPMLQYDDLSYIPLPEGSPETEAQFYHNLNIPEIQHIPKRAAPTPNVPMTTTNLVPGPHIAQPRPQSQQLYNPHPYPLPPIPAAHMMPYPPIPAHPNPSFIHSYNPDPRYHDQRPQTISPPRHHSTYSRSRNEDWSKSVTKEIDVDASKPLHTTPAASAAPQLRDLQKELTTLVPAALARKRGKVGGAKPVAPVVAVRSGGLAKPVVNAAPDVEEETLDAFLEKLVADKAGQEGQFYISYTIFTVLSILMAVAATSITKLSAAQTKATGSNDQEVVYQAAGSGIPEVKIILSGFVIRGFLGLRTLLVKSAALIFSIASGLCIGQQGPLVHIACCIGNVASRLFEKYAKNEAKRREMLSAASAAGVSVAFGAPIGGVLFSLEEVSYYFPSKTMWRSFFCALTAAVTLKLLNPYGTGKLVMFQVTYNHDWHTFEVFPFLLLGVFGGIYGAFFINSISVWASLRKRWSLKSHPLLEIIAISLLTALLSYPLPLTRSSLNELVGDLFSECHDDNALNGLCKPGQYGLIFNTLSTVLMIKIFLIIITFGMLLPAGIFTPSMAVGALAGRILGIWMAELQRQYPESWVFAQCEPGKDCITPGVYAMVGAAATLSGVTRMTVSLAVIMVELTGALTYVLPIMISIMAAKWTADFLSRDSIYDTLIKRAGHPYLDHKHEYHPRSNTLRPAACAADVAERSRDIVGPYGSFGDLTFEVNRPYSAYNIEDMLRLLALSHWSEDGGFPVLDKGILVGFIAFNELSHALSKGLQDEIIVVTNTIPIASSGLSDAPHRRIIFRRGGAPWEDTNADDAASTLLELDFTPWMDQAPLCVTSHTSMEVVTEMFIKLGIKIICVIEPDGRYVGFIHKKKLLTFLNGKIP
ncbi:hypothetical protein HDV05_002153 [Chytridiales sp. JEL 0842]|nr:hypothetical protein HDV05_002153 [Chytridiales sp. JEL 0842]